VLGERVSGGVVGGFAEYLGEEELASIWYCLIDRTFGWGQSGTGTRTRTWGVYAQETPTALLPSLPIRHLNPRPR
jgi:hypothetical protein